MKTMDLNCDLGESFGPYKMGMDESGIKFVTSANIACGWHAGDPVVMDRTVKMAADLGVGVGAHPGYPDLMGFGRRNMDCMLEDIQKYVIYQIGALQAFCKVHGVRLKHVKPHGALYSTAVNNKSVARAIVQAIVNFDSDLLFVALAGSKGESMRQMGQELGLKVVYEAFPDRAYTSDGNLELRSQPGAVITDPEEVAQRALRMAKEGVVIAVDGTSIPIEAQTLCVHGDTPTALKLVQKIRETLEANNIKCCQWGRMNPNA